MPLTGRQVVHLAEQIERWWDLTALSLFAQFLSVDLNSLAPTGSLRERARIFIDHLNSGVPPRDRELLEALRLRGNQPLKDVAVELQTPQFYSPTGDPHDAIVLGRAAFVDRADLRQAVREFTNPGPFTTRVLIVRGDHPCGKSYSWEFLRHLAINTIGAVPQRLRLKDTRFTPRQIFEQVALLLRLDRSEMPPMTDDPQLSRIEPLINWFKGQIVAMDKPYWLVMDDLNDPSITPSMRETAYAIAYAVEEIRPQNLWVALLGYNAPITDPELRHIAQEDARFPDPLTVAEHLQILASTGPRPLLPSVARQIADLLFAKFPTLDKESMIQLGSSIERMGEKLKLGQQP